MVRTGLKNNCKHYQTNIISENTKMDHSTYVQKQLLLKRNFETFMKSNVQSEDTRISMQLFNKLVTESWEHTTKKYKEVRDSLDRGTDYKSIKVSTVDRKSKFSGENDSIFDLVDSGCYWNVSVGNRIPLSNLSKY